jgi:hypothetical protein
MAGIELLMENGSQPREASVGTTGRIKLLEIQTNGIIPTRMRHVIKRYLKKVGFTSLKVEHQMGPNPFTVVLLATGISETPLTESQVSRLSYLKESIQATLNDTKNGFPVHASQADPEKLREKLAKVEPSLSKIYYAVQTLR